VTVAADGLIAGIDTHLDVHVAAVLDRLGRRLGVRGFPATDAGNAQLTGGWRASARSPRPGSRAPAATDTGWPGH
jgi:hypothetical protein